MEHRDLRRRGGSGQRQRPLPRDGHRDLRDDRPGQDLDGVLDLGAEHGHPRPGHPEARPRDGHRHLRPRLLRGRHRADQGVHGGGVCRAGPPVRPQDHDQVEPVRAARRHARRAGQGGQSAGRLDALLLPEGRRPEGHRHDQGPRGRDDPGVDAERQEGAAEGVLGPQPRGRSPARAAGSAAAAAADAAGSAATWSTRASTR